MQRCVLQHPLAGHWWGPSQRWCTLSQARLRSMNRLATCWWFSGQQHFSEHSCQSALLQSAGDSLCTNPSQIHLRTAGSLQGGGAYQRCQPARQNPPDLPHGLCEGCGAASLARRQRLHCPVLPHAAEQCGGRHIAPVGMPLNVAALWQLIDRGKLEISEILLFCPAPLPSQLLHAEHCIL